MSGGMEDSRRLDRAATELEQAAWKLKQAIDGAGVRGWKVDVLHHVNDVLRAPVHGSAPRRRLRQLRLHAAEQHPMRPHDVELAVFPSFVAARYMLGAETRVVIFHNDTHRIARKQTWSERLLARNANAKKNRQKAKKRRRAS